MHIARPISRQPIPRHAQRVFRGKLFDVYQWQQPMYDGTTATFEKLRRPDTVVVFGVMDDGQILLSRQQQPGKTAWIGALGGRVDDGEAVLDAAKRELREESGYEAATFTLWHAEQPVSKIEWAVYVFIAKGLTRVSDQTLDSGEKIELLPVSFDEFLRMGTLPGFTEREIVPQLYQARLDKTAYATLRQLFAV